MGLTYSGVCKLWNSSNPMFGASTTFMNRDTESVVVVTPNVGLIYFLTASLKTTGQKNKAAIERYSACKNIRTLIPATYTPLNGMRICMGRRVTMGHAAPNMHSSPIHASVMVFQSILHARGGASGSMPRSIFAMRS